MQNLVCRFCFIKCKTCTVVVFLLTVSMENITTDIHELERGMELTKREYDLRKNSRDQPTVLKDFLANSEDKLRKLLSDVRTAQVKKKLINLFSSSFVK